LTQQRPLPAADATRPNPMPPSSRYSGALQLQSIDVIVQNPLDVLARLALAEGFDRERLGEHDLHMGLPGHWCDHHVSFSWKEKEGLLQLYLVFETRIPPERSAAMTLIAAATEAAEKAYPAMQYVLWAEKTPEAAIEQALFDIAVRADARHA